MPNSQRRWTRILAWVVPIALVLGIVAVFVVRAAIDSYLRSPAFRDFLGRRIGDSLHARVELAPLNFSGLSVHSDTIDAAGARSASFSTGRIESVRAELSLRRFFEQIWQVESVDIQRLELSLDGPRIADAVDSAVAVGAAASGPAEARPVGERSRGFFPNRVEVAQVNVREAALAWSGGKLSGSAMRMVPQDGSLLISAQGGTLAQAGMPPVEVQSVRLVRRGSVIFVQAAELRQPGGGSVNVNGEVRPADGLDLRAKVAGISVTPLLPEDWRVRLRGNLAGEATIRSRLPADGPIEIRGTMELQQGQLEALPVLDQIADFTRTLQFRRLALTRASGDFVRTGTKLVVTNFGAESAGLIRVEGAFTVEAGRIEGNFQVGVTASSLQWLPGSQARVFTEARGGYLWTPMRLSGPLEKPEDDLTPRLAAAAAGAVIDVARDALKDPVKAGKDVLKGALDLLLQPPR